LPMVTKIPRQRSMVQSSQNRRFMVYGLRFTVHGLRFTVYGSRSTVHGSRSTVYGGRCTIDCISWRILICRDIGKDTNLWI
jgi:hypothetical protein